MEESVPKKKIPAGLIAGLAAAALVVAAVGGYLGLCAWVRDNGQLLPGAVAVDDRGEAVADLGKLTREEALSVVGGALDQRLVNRTLTCPDVVYSIFLREETDYIKVSARSKGDFPVNKMCAEFFNGGGHLNAAGGEFHGTLEQAVERLLEAMPLFDRYLPE